ncbi:nuclear transport factor 2 family protein [Streptomyces sp. NPDC051572]|uniref:nuclear transport factor 2 family protein n=1 Tax=unclassified Streptomyces TaxID=2593676 RepID=UPI00344F6D8A
MAACFTADAVHYFPPGLEGPWQGARVIAENWRRRVPAIGSAWTIDRLITDPVTNQAVIEWTHLQDRAERLPARRRVVRLRPRDRPDHRDPRLLRLPRRRPGPHRTGGLRLPGPRLPPGLLRRAPPPGRRP